MRVVSRPWPRRIRGLREVVSVHRVDNGDTIAALRAKGMPRLGTVTRMRVLWRVRFDWGAPADAVRTVPSSRMVSRRRDAPAR